MSDMSGDGTIEMDHASRSSAASTDKSTASPKSGGSPTPSSHASGSAPGSAPDDYVMVELVSLMFGGFEMIFFSCKCSEKHRDLIAF